MQGEGCKHLSAEFGGFCFWSNRTSLFLAGKEGRTGSRQAMKRQEEGCKVWASRIQQAKASGRKSKLAFFLFSLPLFWRARSDREDTKTRETAHKQSGRQRQGESRPGEGPGSRLSRQLSRRADQDSIERERIKCRA